MAFMEPSYCCGCSLKTRAIVIGCLYAILNFGHLAFGILYMVHRPPQEELTLTQEDLTKMNITEDIYEGLRVIITACDYSFFIGGVFSAALLILSILLVYGAVKENPRLVKLWVVWAVMSLIVNTIIGMVFIALFAYYDIHIYSTKVVVSLIIGGAIFTWNIMTVNSYYHVLRGPTIVPTILNENETLPGKEKDDYRIVYGNIEPQQIFQITTTPEKIKY